MRDCWAQEEASSSSAESKHEEPSESGAEQKKEQEAQKQDNSDKSANQVSTDGGKQAAQCTGEESDSLNVKPQGSRI